jgi:hypothetical protein
VHSAEKPPALRRAGVDLLEEHERLLHSLAGRGREQLVLG